MTGRDFPRHRRFYNMDTVERGKIRPRPLDATKVPGKDTAKAICVFYFFNDDSTILRFYAHRKCFAFYDKSLLSLQRQKKIMYYDH